MPWPVHLSLVPVHRRGSFYTALEKGRIDAGGLKELLASYDLGAKGTTPIYAIGSSEPLQNLCSLMRCGCKSEKITAQSR